MSDSEYSLNTGNLEEFVLERVAFFEDIHMMCSKEPELVFFLQYIAEDIAMAWALGSDLLEIRIPIKVYQRRLETHPLMMEKAQIKMQVCSLGDRNPFGSLSKEALTAARSLFKRFGNESCIKEVVKEFPYLFEKKTEKTMEEDYDDQEEEEHGMEGHSKSKYVMIKRTALSSDQQKQISAANLERYEKLQKSIETGRANLVKVIEKMMTVWALSKSVKDLALVKKQSSSGGDKSTGSLSYNAKMIIRGLNMKDKSFSLPRKLNKRGCKGYEVLDRLRSIQERVARQIEAHSLITMISASKLHDLLTVLIKSQMLEEEFIAYCNGHDEPDCRHYFFQIRDLTNELTHYLEMKKYPKDPVFAEDDKIGLQSIQSRLDNIRGKIYGTYNKAKQISRQIWHLRKVAIKQTK